MNGPSVVRYGAWPSPLSPRLVALERARVAWPGFGPFGQLCWVEARARDDARNVLMARDAEGGVTELVSAPFDVKSRVHEYGGLPWTCLRDVIYFVNNRDQRIYALDSGAAPRAVTEPGYRFVDLTPDPLRGRLLAVAESRTSADVEAENSIVAIDPSTGSVQPLVTGRSFYASPRVDPRGERLAYLAWNHPHMPWDAAELHVAQIDSAGVSEARHVAGDDSASALQPGWLADGTLVFAWEPSGYWNLHAWRGDCISVIHSAPAECGLPLWQLGMSTWAPLGDGEIAAAQCRDGKWELWRLSLDGDSERLSLVDDSIYHVVAGASGQLALLAAHATAPLSIVLYDTARRQRAVARSPLGDLPLEPRAISTPEHLTLPTGDGTTRHAWYHPPRLGGVEPPIGELPPLIVLVHGGPTACATPFFTLGVQFWTTRGFGVLQVDYRGSCGYGRRYRDALKGQFGVLDVDDCVAFAESLAGAGRVDPRRMALRGASSGGFTALAALAFRCVFSAGSIYSGVSRLGLIPSALHKFESHYVVGLVGPFPEHAETYAARSPARHSEGITVPTIFFHGARDPVVPQGHTLEVVTKLRECQRDVEFLSFEAEGHGFRHADSIERALEAELAFYRRVFGLEEPASPGDKRSHAELRAAT